MGFQVDLIHGRGENIRNNHVGVFTKLSDDNGIIIIIIVFSLDVFLLFFAFIINGVVRNNMRLLLLLLLMVMMFMGIRCSQFIFLGSGFVGCRQGWISFIDQGEGNFVRHVGDTALLAG